MRLSSGKNYADVMNIVGGIKNINRLHELLMPHVVAEYYSYETGENFLELRSTDHDDLIGWIKNHPDAVKLDFRRGQGMRIIGPIKP